MVDGKWREKQRYRPPELRPYKEHTEKVFDLSQCAGNAPWERQKGESQPAYEAFVTYRDMPNRALSKTARALGKSGKIVERWTKRWGWHERIRAWDNEVDRRKREVMFEEIEAMNRRHAQEAMVLQQKAVERLRELDPGDLGTGQVLSYMIEAAKMERAARGVADRVVQELSGPDGKPVQVESGVDLSRLSEEELRALAAIRRRLAGGTD